MAVPKKRTSLTRRRLRRTHHKIQTLARSHCTNCNAIRINFNVCQVCGTYKGKQYIQIQDTRA